MDVFTVRVPCGVKPGTTFRCLVNNKEYYVPCPWNVRPGQTIKIKVPKQTQDKNNKHNHAVLPQTTSAPTLPVQTYSPSSAPPLVTPPRPVQSSYITSTPTPPEKARDSFSYFGSGNISPEAMFELIDSEKIGYVNSSQVKQALEYAGLSKVPRKVCNLMIEHFSKDQNRIIDLKDFSVVFQLIIAWKELFEEYDQDKDGSIAIQTMNTAIKAYGYRFSEEFFNLLVQKYDEDHNTLISIEEFIQLFCELYLLTEAFKERDEERNGVATFNYEDFLQACFTIR